MRILCLHGRRQSAEIFSQRLQRLSKRLQQLQRSSGLEITLVFSEAPHLMASRGDDSVTMPTWWRSDGRDWLDSLISIDRDLQKFEDLDTNPIVGILGFSQGAAMAALLVALADDRLQSQDDKMPTDLLQRLRTSLRYLAFVILAGAPMDHFPSSAPFCTPQRSFAPPHPLPVRSLHAFSSADMVVSIEQSRALSRCFHEPTLLEHDKGHVVPGRTHELDILVAFIQQACTSKSSDGANGQSAAEASPNAPALSNKMTERQQDEFTALQDIFGDDCNLESEIPPTISVALSHTPQHSTSRPRLYITFTPDYPDSIPIINVGSISNAQKKELVPQLQLQAQENLGMEMVFQLVEAANELVGNLQTTSETAEDTLAQPDADNGNSQEDSGPSMLGIEEPEGFDHGPLIAAATNEAAQADERCSTFLDPRSGVWKFTVGLVGKPSAGKSTFFNAITDPRNESDAARVASFPFTTIDPNIAQGYFRTTNPLRSPRQPDSASSVLDARVGIIIKDVAGLVPGAYQGRGKGNAFLNDLCDADVLIHVLDASGCSDKEGQILPDANGDPAEDVAWVRHEVHQWIYNNVRAKWTAVCRRPEKLAAMFTGYKAPLPFVAEALRRMDIDITRAQLLKETLRRWTPADLHRLVAHFLRVRFPMLLGLNKVDVNDKHVERLKQLFSHDVCIPMSAKAEWSLCQWRRKGLIDYDSVAGSVHLKEASQTLPSKDQAALKEAVQHYERLRAGVACLNHTTGVVAAVNAAVALRQPLLVFPVADLDELQPLALNADAEYGDEAPCLLMYPGATANDVFVALKTLKILSGEFVRAECWDYADAASPSKRPLRKQEVLTTATQIISIMTNRKARWQQELKRQ